VLLRSRAPARSVEQPGRSGRDTRKPCELGMGENDRLASKSGFLKKQRRAKAREPALQGSFMRVVLVAVAELAG